METNTGREMNYQLKFKDVNLVTIRKGMHRIEFKTLFVCPVTGDKSYCQDVETFKSKKQAEMFRNKLLIKA